MKINSGYSVMIDNVCLKTDAAVRYIDYYIHTVLEEGRIIKCIPCNCHEKLLVHCYSTEYSVDLAIRSRTTSLSIWVQQSIMDMYLPHIIIVCRFLYTSE